MMNSASQCKEVATKEEVVRLIEQLRGGAKERLPYGSIRSAISGLTDRVGYQTYMIPVGEALTLHRARLIDPGKTPLLSASELGPPSADKTNNFGRCHRPGNPLCYCSLYENTVLSEVDAKLGKHYAISTFELLDDIVVVPIGDLDHYRRTGTTYLGEETSESDSATRYEELLNTPDGAVVALIDAFFANEFGQKAQSESDYKITSALCDVLLNDFNPAVPIDAIVYPSVAFLRGHNFAIRPDLVWPAAANPKLKLIDSEIGSSGNRVGDFGVF